MPFILFGNITAEMERGKRKVRAKGPTPRQLQALATRQKIFEAAVKLFASEGYENVTIDAICEEAGVSKGSYYNHFTSKEHIIIQQFINVDVFFRDASHLLDSSTSSFVDRIHAIADFASDSITAVGYDTARAVYSALIMPGKKTSFAVSENLAVFPVLVEVVRQGQGNGEVRQDIDAFDIALYIVGCYRGLVYDWCLEENAWSLKERTRQMISMLLDGILVH
ncbi:MAG: TetR family transcriptional regulator [Candidatus Saccharibacteria bacterium]